MTPITAGRLPSTHQGLLASAVLASLEAAEGPAKTLDTQGFAGDIWGMDTKQPPFESQFKTTDSGPQGVFDAALCQDPGTLDGMASNTSLGDRITYAIEKRADKEISKSALARAIGVTPQTLAAMCRPSYNRPEDWAKVRLLALKTGWSYEWIKDGKGKSPRQMDGAEAEAVRAELENSAPLEQRQALPEGAVAFSPMQMMKLWGVVVSHPRVQAEGWNADEVFTCLLKLYEDTNGGKADLTAIAAYIQNFRF